jgi:hypothetical protein
MLSTLSFSISKHYCSNILVDTAVIQPAKTCGMHSQSESYKPEEEKDSCCDDEVKLIEGQDELQLSVSDFSLDMPNEFAVFSMVFLFPEFYTVQSQPVYAIYQPPECRRDIQTLFQVFLI